MIELDERLQQLAESIDLPGTSPQDDLARARARRRHRNLGVVGAAVATAALVGSTALLVAGGSGHGGASPDFAGGVDHSAGQTPDTRQQRAEELRKEALDARRAAESITERNGPVAKAGRAAVLAGYRDVLREHLDPAGEHLQLGPITNEQGGDGSLGTKLEWNGGGMLQVAVGRTLEGVQFFCDHICTRADVAGASKALVLTSPGRISVAVFQDDGDIVALTADTSFGNNGTSTDALGLTLEQLLTAAADQRLDLPAVSREDQLSDLVGTQ